MGKVRGSAGGAGDGRRSRWRRGFYRFFSCVGVGGDAASSFDHADAPVTPQVNSSGTDNFPSSSACNDSGVVFTTAVPDEPELSIFASDSVEFCVVTEDTDQPANSDQPTPSADDESRSTPRMSASASTESIDLYVADYVQRYRNQPNMSYPDIYSVVPGCRPKMLFASHAAHLKNLAPWMVLSYDVESVSSASVPLPEYDVNEFGKVDITCADKTSDPAGFSSDQFPNAQVTATIYSPNLVEANFKRGECIIRKLCSKY